MGNMLPHMQVMWLDGALPMDIMLPHMQVMWLDGDCNCSTQLQKMSLSWKEWTQTLFRHAMFHTEINKMFSNCMHIEQPNASNEFD